VAGQFTHHSRITLTVGALTQKGEWIVGRKQQVVAPLGRKRGEIVKKPNGSYLVRIPIGKGLDGRYHSTSKVIRGTYKQADQLRVKMLGELDKGGVIATTKQTVAEYMEQWLKGTAALKVSPRTLTMYRYITTKYIVARIGTLRLASLSPQTVQAMYAGMTTDGLGPRMVQYAHSILKQALGQAVIWRQLPFNPCDNVARPKMVKKEMSVLTAAQVSAMLSGTRDEFTWGTLWHVMLNTGMRPQEAAALTWTDIAGDKLTITKALVEVSPGHYEIGPCKTDRSRRCITIPQSTVTSLAAHRLEQTRRIMKSGPAYKRNGLIFATRNGENLCLHNVYRAWRSALKRLHLPPVTLYCCRHTHISLLLASGEPGPAVAERAGHSLKVMMDVYAHVIPETVPQTAANFEGILLKAAATGA
jgi:integrase